MKIKTNDKLDKAVKRSKVVYYVIGAIGMLFSLGILAAFFMPKKSCKKIESVNECPEEIYMPDEEDIDDEKEVEQV